MNLPEWKCNMPAFIVCVLLLYFGLALFGKPLGVVVSTNDPLVQTLINLTIAAASYFIGTSQGSAKKDEIIAASTPPTPPVPGTVVTTETPGTKTTEKTE